MRVTHILRTVSQNEPKSKPGQVKSSKGQPQPEAGAATFVVLYIGLGTPCEYQVLIVTHVSKFLHGNKKMPDRKDMILLQVLRR